MIAVIDYKAGNLTSVVKALSYIWATNARCGRHAVA
jgi:imidazoleglycerol phosphate synthase glutamine amidotransferase subunit HisH